MALGLVGEILRYVGAAGFHCQVVAYAGRT